MLGVGSNFAKSKIDGLFEEKSPSIKIVVTYVFLFEVLLHAFLKEQITYCVCNESIMKVVLSMLLI